MVDSSTHTPGAAYQIYIEFSAIDSHVRAKAKMKVRILTMLIASVCTATCDEVATLNDPSD